MAISQKRYVDITSGVGGAAVASERELIARLITTNQLAPMGSVMEFTSLDNVGIHFGTGSAEYACFQNRHETEKTFHCALCTGSDCAAVDFHDNRKSPCQIQRNP